MKKLSKTIQLACAMLFFSPTSFAQEVNHSTVVQTVYYNQVDAKYQDPLYLFQLVLSKNCLNYQTEEQTCSTYLEDKRDSVSSAWHAESDPVKKQYLNIKLEMIENTRVVLADVHHGDQGYFSPIVADSRAIMEDRFGAQAKQLIVDHLKENDNTLSTDYISTDQRMLLDYTEQAYDYRQAVMEPEGINVPQPTKKEKIHYQELLFAKKYLESKISLTAAENELNGYIKDVIRDLTECAECTTDVIVKVTNNNNVTYQEMSLAEIALVGFERFGPGSGDVSAIYPEKYLVSQNGKISVARFMFELRQYILQNQETLLFTRDELESGAMPSDIDKMSWEVMKDGLAQPKWASKIWNLGVVPNIRRLFNSLVAITTGPTGATFVDSASKAMNQAVTSNFKIAHFGKTFNIASAITAGVRHLPKVIIGESERHLCNSDEIAGSGFTNGITLEEKCVYVPDFSYKSFPITVSSLFDQQEGSALVDQMANGNTATVRLYQVLPSFINPWEWIFSGLHYISGVDPRQYGQDIMGYRVSLVHDSGSIVFRNIIFEKQQLTLTKEPLYDADVSHYTLKIFSNLNNNEVANFRLNEAMFLRVNSGVVKGNKFYFVEEVFDNQKPEYVNKTRASKVCGLAPQGTKDEEFYYECLSDKYFPRIIPDYYMDNMRVVSKPE
ncbi:hypothetical protein BS333_16450 [Vibrio azureus]|uniref:Uncharacterized protein n=1 Tax=Vibrio azureus NBRC 104587 TaxID=1219077 RepID=U3A7Y1_9VIBR|nr:hypothetical protein [Vibrio azureus]AUI87974.1 hypothetical protein BS333_16450 [Vibrio azureus]GAD76071.1 hypothetical protein VAZ01S_036_00150 [Vibrio azureus NBRC 104587]